MSAEPEFPPVGDPGRGALSVTAPARLHLGFLDLNGGLGRRFGGFGVILDGIATRLSASRAEGIAACGPSAERARAFADEVRKGFGIAGGVQLAITEAIPEHAGLGSGTQLGLAVGAAYTRLYGLEAGPREIALKLSRGARSGIGIGAFEQGGVLVDGGRREDDTGIAPVIGRVEFPAAWRIILILDRRARGLHGEAEMDAFRRLSPFPAELSGRLCRLLLMAALPALAEADLPRFAAAVAEIQNTVGDYFAAAQGGRFASPAVARALSWFAQRGLAGLGQSSWGPTGFAVVEDEPTARALLRAAQANWADDDRLGFMICRGRNTGGRVEAVGLPAAAGGARRG